MAVVGFLLFRPDTLFTIVRTSEPFLSSGSRTTPTSTTGPDLYVWVLAVDGYQEGIPTEYIDRGRLTGNMGSQNFELPDDFDPRGLYRTVLVWCLRIAVPFATALLT